MLVGVRAIAEKYDRVLKIVDKRMKRKRKKCAVPVLLFNDKTIMFMMNGVFVPRELVDKFHGRVAQR